MASPSITLPEDIHDNDPRKRLAAYREIVQALYYDHSVDQQTIRTWSVFLNGLLLSEVSRLVEELELVT